MREGRYQKAAEAKRHTLSNLIDRYLREIIPGKRNRPAQEAQLNWWKAQLGHLVLADVAPAAIAACRDTLLREPIKRRTKKGESEKTQRTRSKSTVVRYLAALSHVFSVGVREWGWVDDNPVRKITKPTEPRGRVRFLTDDERHRLLEACRASDQYFLYPVVVLALSTGMRRGEVMNIKWSDVDLDHGIAVLQETKNGQRRAVPVTGHALDLIRGLNPGRICGSELLFPSSRVRSQAVDLTSAWRRAVKAAGIRDFRFHDLRHSAASYLAMGGATPSELAAVLGHKTLQMVQRYAHIGEQHTHKLVTEMNRRIFS
jgi:integrase